MKGLKTAIWLLHFIVITFVITCGFTPGTKKTKKISVSGASLEEKQKASRMDMEVVFASPKGKVDGQPQISVSFSLPVKKLALADASSLVDGQVVFAIEPRIDGEYVWLGTRTVVFKPSSPIPMATKFRARVKAGLKSLSGKRLKEDYVWEFETPAPEVVDSYPYEGYLWATPDVGVKVYFNQKVEPVKVKEHTSFYLFDANGRRSEVDFTVSQLSGTNGKAVLIRPVKKIPMATRCVVHISGELTGAEGPIKMGKDKMISFMTYGPFKVKKIRCGWVGGWGDGEGSVWCSPSDSVVLVLTNRFNPRQIEKVVKVVPPVRGISFHADNAEGGRIIISGDFKPGKKYTITFSGAFRDRFNQKLEGRRKFHLFTKDYESEFQFGFGGQILEKNLDRKVYVSTLNFASLDVGVLHLFAPEEIINVYGGLCDEGRGSCLDEVTTFYVDKIKRFKFETAGRRNRWVKNRVDLASAGRGGDGTGLYFISAVGEYGFGRFKRDYRFIKVTDIGITTKAAADHLMVWATYLSSGRVIDSAKVVVRDGEGKILWEGRTDKNGVAIVPARYLWKRKDYFFTPSGMDWPFVFVSKDGDFNFTRVNGGADGISPWSFDIPFSTMAAMEKLVGVLITDRGVYRPGQKLAVKGIVRYLRGGKIRIPKGQRFVLKVKDSHGEMQFIRQVSCDSFGGFSIEIPISSAGPTGYWEILFAKNEDDFGRPYSYLSRRFSVEEYRAPKFKVSVIPRRKEVVRGYNLPFTVKGEYFFGGPMKGAEVSYHVTCDETWFHPPEFSQYLFGEERGWWQREEVSHSTHSSAKGKLDDVGLYADQISTDFQDVNVNSALRCRVEADVESPDRQEISGRSYFTVHPAGHYIGLLSDTKVVGGGKKLKLKIITVDSISKKLVGNRSVSVRVYSRKWQVVRSEGLYDDYYEEWRPVEEKVGSCKVLTSERGAASCSVLIPSGGEYVVRATSYDEKKRKALTSTVVWAYGSGADVTWRRDKSIKLELAADARVYEIGQKASILVQNPFKKAIALVTVEREGVINYFVKEFTTRSPVIEIPVGDEMVPVAYISVVVVRGRVKRPPPGGGVDLGRPTVRVGYVPIAVNIDDKSLAVGVHTDKREYRPGQKVQLLVEVKNKKNHNAEKGQLTVFVVDEAALSLTSFKLPKLLPIFYGRRSVGVKNTDSRITIMERRKFGVEKGRVGGGGRDFEEQSLLDAARKIFQTTPYFNPHVLTDGEGKAKLSFRLPEGLTSYRVFVVAQTKDNKFGHGSTILKVNKPLLLKEALPRFVRVGDRFSAGVLVYNRDFEREVDVAVSVHVEGMGIVGPSRKKIHLTPGEGREVRFDFVADRVSENGVFRFNAESPPSGSGKRAKLFDALEVRIPVKMPLFTQTVAYYGQTGDMDVVGMDKIEDVRKDVGGLNISVSSTALIGLDKSIESLVKYPYGCSEQKTSRLIPMIALDEICDEYGIDIGIDRQRLEETVADLQRMQFYSGGWGYFSDSICPSPWLSAYVLWGLYQAKLRGYSVDENVIERGVSFLRRVLRDEWNYPRRRCGWWKFVSLPSKAFGAYVLADIGRGMPSYNEYLYDRRDDLPLFGRVLLAGAIYLTEADGGKLKLDELSDDTQEMIGTLIGQVVNHIQQTPSSAQLVEDVGDECAMIMYSNLRSNAMALSIFLKIMPDSFLLPKMVRFIMASRKKNGTWGSTQENAYVLLALSDWWRIKEREEPDFLAKVFSAGKKLFSWEFSGRNLKTRHGFVKMEDVIDKAPFDVKLVSSGRGTLFYSLSLDYYIEKMPEEPLERGIFIERKYMAFDEFVKFRQETSLQGKNCPVVKFSPTVSKVRAGDSIVVELTVVTTGERSFVVVDDPVPAGFEIVNKSFSTVSMAEVEEIEEARSGYNPFYHTEIYDDRFVAFADELRPGIYHYYYLVRATTEGKFKVPPARVEQMYYPEVFGRTAGAQMEIY